MASTVAIVDYGMGNLDSVARAVVECGGQPMIVRDREGLSKAAAVILPGVGAFTKGMANIRDRRIDLALGNAVAEGTPLLGVCLGMQLLAARGEEGGGCDGLNLIPGIVRRIEPAEGVRIPHVGWNEVRHRKPSKLFEGLADGLDFYFVHSFQFCPDAETDIVAVTPYGSPLVAAVERGRIYGVQFHPEKSQRTGFALLRNFLSVAGCASTREPEPVSFAAPRH
jgi:glutamine amidotransferase